MNFKNLVNVQFYCIRTPEHAIVLVYCIGVLEQCWCIVLVYLEPISCTDMLSTLWNVLHSQMLAHVLKYIAIIISLHFVSLYIYM